MRIRLGALTGDPTSSGEDTAGCYISLGEGREDLVGLKAMYYGRRKIWPGEGLMRITSIQLSLDTELSNLLIKYQMSTNDFTGGGGYLSLTIGTRTFTRSEHRADIRWDASTDTLYFLGNNGPWAEEVLRGDYATLHMGFSSWTDTVRLESSSTSSQVVRYIQPITTCDVYLGADWSGDTQGLAALYNADGSVRKSVSGQVSEGKKDVAKHGQEAWVRGVTHSGHIALAGTPSCAIAKIVYPASAQELTSKVISITIQE